MSKNDCHDFLEYNMERSDKYNETYQSLNDKITRLTEKYI